MSEMLGNQYFLARNYKDALKEYEPLISSHQISKTLLRKLIIIYTQIGKISKAFELFRKLIKEDIQFIMDADPETDDCPCSEIVNKGLKINNDSLEAQIYAGILWLYCDPIKSLFYFKNALRNNPSSKEIQESISIIESHLNLDK